MEDLLLAEPDNQEYAGIFQQLTEVSSAPGSLGLKKREGVARVSQERFGAGDRLDAGVVAGGPT